MKKILALLMVVLTSFLSIECWADITPPPERSNAAAVRHYVKEFAATDYAWGFKQAADINFFTGYIAGAVYKDPNVFDDNFKSQLSPKAVQIINKAPKTGAFIREVLDGQRTVFSLPQYFDILGDYKYSSDAKTGGGFSNQGLVQALGGYFAATGDTLAISKLIDIYWRAPSTASAWAKRMLKLSSENHSLSYDQKRSIKAAINHPLARDGAFRPYHLEVKKRSLGTLKTPLYFYDKNENKAIDYIKVINNIQWFWYSNNDNHPTSKNKVTAEVTGFIAGVIQNDPTVLPEWGKLKLSEKTTEIIASAKASLPDIQTALNVKKDLSYDTIRMLYGYYHSSGDERVIDTLVYVKRNRSDGRQLAAQDCLRRLGNHSPAVELIILKENGIE